MQDLVKGFLNSDLRNAWLATDDALIYVRKANHLYGTQLLPTLDLVNINIHRPGQGVFTGILTALESLRLDGERVIRIENIQDERFKNFFIKRGYQMTGNGSGEWCAWSQL